MVRIVFETKNERETNRIWKILRRHLLDASSEVTELILNEDGIYHAGSKFQVQGCFYDIFMMCLDIRKIPKKIDILG